MSNTMIYFMLPVIFFIFFSLLGSLISAISKAAKKRNVSSDGHIVPENEDLTCENLEGHHHESNNEYGSRYIVHNEPEDGYVVLNGVMRKIEDCKDL